MTKFFLVAFPLAALAEVSAEEPLGALLAEVSAAEELSAPAAVHTDELLEARRLIGPAWTWPVKAWTGSNPRGCPWFQPSDGQTGSNDQRGLTCNYSKVCCPPFLNGKCVARKQAKCTNMYPSGCRWGVEDYGNTMWKNGVCSIVHAGKQPQPSPTPRPTPKPEESYRSLGAGKCLTSDRADPPNQYYAGLGDAQCKNKCNQRSDCGGYSVSGYNNCLIWLTTDLVGGGANWDGASCIVKKSNRPPVHHSYRSLGTGKCLTPNGADPRHEYISGFGDAKCKNKCNQRSDCGGYSVSGANNCLLWLTSASGLVGGGGSWDGADCIVKTSLPPAKKGWWWCEDGKEEIQSRYRCDGVCDCTDCSDEDPWSCLKSNQSN